MAKIITSRRSLLMGLASLLAAPAIVRASNLMPVKAWKPEAPHRYLGMAQLKLEGGSVLFDIEGTDAYGNYVKETIEIAANEGLPVETIREFRSVTIGMRDAILVNPRVNFYS